MAINHPDLKDQLWVNRLEIPNNGLDDDQNGYIDDIHGYNFRNNTRIQADPPITAPMYLVFVSPGAIITKASVALCQKQINRTRLC